MKRIISLFLSIALLISAFSAFDISAYAISTSGSCGDNATWEYSNGTLTISGTGKIKDYESTSGPATNYFTVYNYPWTDVQYRINNLVIEEGITEIGLYNFGGLSYLTNVSFPSTLKKVKYGAFEGCQRLERVNAVSLEAWCDINFTWDTSNPTHYANHLFIDDEEIIDLVLPDIKTVKPYSFVNMTYIESITFPNTLETIECNAFYNCNQITTLNFPESLTEIGVQAFESCDSLTQINFAEGIKTIQYNAFYNCNKLTEVRFPNSLEYLRGSSFSECEKLQVVYFGYGIKVIEDNFDKRTDIYEKYPITDVYYYGDEEALSKVKIDEFNDDFLMKANWHFIHNHVYYIIADELSENPHVAYRIYRCDCGSEYKEIYRLPIKFTFKEYKNGNFYYDCEVCEWDDYISKYTIKKLWTNYCNGVQINPTLMYDETFLDVTNDGVINGKDYAKIQHLSNYGY